MGLRDACTGNLDALVSGKRRAPRLGVETAVRIKCAERVFDALARDVSAGGARIELESSLLVDESGEKLDPVEQFTFLERHFGGSFDLEFPGALVVVEACLKRLAVSPDAADAFSLGCEFVHPLSTSQQRALGLRGEVMPEEAAWDMAIRVHDLHHEEDPTRPVTAMLLDDLAVMSGPLFLGPVTAVGRRAVVVRLDGTQCADVAEALAQGDIHVRLLRGVESLLTTRADFVSGRYTDGTRPGCDVLLTLRTRLPRSVRKSFRRAA